MTYPDTLVFLGAGASAPFGIPTMRGMAQLLRTDPSLLSPEYRKISEPIWSHLNQFYGDASDIEKFLTIVHGLSEGRDLHETLRDFGPYALYVVRGLLDSMPSSYTSEVIELDRRIRTAKSDFERLELVVIEQIARWCLVADFEKAKKVYREFFESLLSESPFQDSLGHATPSRRISSQSGIELPMVSIATTNYDECVERALGELGVATETGFVQDRETQIGRFDLGCKFDVLDRVPLMKLHGSVSWSRTYADEIVCVPETRRNSTMIDGSKLGRREMRYPVVTKDLGGLPYGAIYARFAEALAAARVWIVIGYSFGDPSIVQLFHDLWTTEKTFVEILPPRKYREPTSSPIRPRAWAPTSRLFEHVRLVEFAFGEAGVVGAMARWDEWRFRYGVQKP